MNGMARFLVGLPLVFLAGSLWTATAQARPACLEDPARALPQDARIQPTPRAEAPLQREQLSIPAATGR